MRESTGTARPRNPWWMPPFLSRVPDISQPQIRLLGSVGLAPLFEQYDQSILNTAPKQIAETLGAASGLFLVSWGTPAGASNIPMIGAVVFATGLAGLVVLMLPETGSRELEEISDERGGAQGGEAAAAPGGRRSRQMAYPCRGVAVGNFHRPRPGAGMP